MHKQKLIVWMAITLLCALCIVDTIIAQDKESWKDTTSAIVGEILIKGSAYEKLLELSDVVGTRVTGTPEFHKAADWALEQMKEIGLKNARKEMWPIKEGTWRRGRSAAYLLTPFEHKIHAESMGWTPGTPEGGVEADVINIGGFKMASEADPSLWSHKILLLDPSREPEPEPGAPPMRWEEMRELSKNIFKKAAEAGAVAVFIPYDVRGNRPHVGGGTAYSLPVLSVGMEDGQFLQRLTRRGNVKVTMYVDFENEFSKEEGQGCNVIGEIPGSEFPEEVVVVGGHLDCWDTGYGVQDDGAGVIALLETARAFMSLGIQPRRTIRFVCFGGEEQGFLGSKAYLEAHEEELCRHVAMFNHDNGAGEPLGFAIAEDRYEVKKEMSKILDRLANLGATQLVLRNPGGTDARPFNESGIPVFDMKVGMEGYREIHHQNTDTFEWMERDNFVIGVAFYAASIYSVANLPARIGDFRPPKKEEKAER